MITASFVRVMIIAVLLATPAVARRAHKAAPNVADIATQWGIAGTWAIDCAKPATMENGYQRYVRRGNDLMLERDFGDRQDANKVVSAKVLPSGALELDVEFTNLAQTRAMAFSKDADDRVRALSNRDVKGGTTVRDGKFVGGGTTPWQSRCP